MNEILTYMISYLAVGLIFMGLMNFLTNGFMLTFIRVKASRGKFVLVKVRGLVQDYFRVGRVSDGFLVYKDPDRKERRLSLIKVTDEDKKKGISQKDLPRSPIYRCLNVFWLDVDDQKNAVVQPDFSVVTGYDAVAMQDFCVRLIKQPSTSTPSIDIQIIKWGVIIGVLICIGILVAVIAGNDTLLKQIVSQTSITAGNIVGGV